MLCTLVSTEQASERIRLAVRKAIQDKVDHLDVPNIMVDGQTFTITQLPVNISDLKDSRGVSHAVAGECRDAQVRMLRCHAVHCSNDALPSTDNIWAVARVCYHESVITLHLLACGP
jgi:hypothetical protein